MNDPIRYVVGFLFNNKDEVALIRKTKPPWQANKLNGIGGKVEPGETFLQAMVREFHEEAGVLIEKWDHVARFVGRDSLIDVFTCLTDECELESMTEEEVGWYDIEDLTMFDCVPNLCWLVPFARSTAPNRDFLLLVSKQLDNIDAWMNVHKRTAVI